MKTLISLALLLIYSLNMSASTYYVSLKVFLSGAYDPNIGMMSDKLRSCNLIPANEPYSYAPFFMFFGGESVSNPSSVFNTPTFVGNAIVDWVHIELRNATNQIVAVRNALVQRDGDVVETDGITTYLPFIVSTAGNYFVAIKHRNHLGVMTANTIALSSNFTAPTLIDFTLSTTACWTNSTYLNQPRRTQGVVSTLWAGDAYYNKIIAYNGSFNDRNAIINALGLNSPNAIYCGVYRTEDTNLDCCIKYTGLKNDRDVIFQSYLAAGVSLTNALREHIP